MSGKRTNSKNNIQKWKGEIGSVGKNEQQLDYHGLSRMESCYVEEVYFGSEIVVGAKNGRYWREHVQAFPADYQVSKSHHKLYPWLLYR